MDHLVKRLSVKIDLFPLRQEVSDILSHYPFSEYQNQINLLTRSPDHQNPYYEAQSLYDHQLQPTHREEEFKYFLKPWKDGYIHRLSLELQKFSGAKIGRIRLMLLRPKTCYSFHVDDNYRYHLALETHPACFLAFKGGLFHVPADGCLYWMNTLEGHTAFNGSSANRVHLVFSTASGNLNTTIHSKSDL